MEEYRGTALVVLAAVVMALAGEDGRKACEGNPKQAIKKNKGVIIRYITLTMIDEGKGQC